MPWASQALSSKGLIVGVGVGVGVSVGVGVDMILGLCIHVSAGCLDRVLSDCGHSAETGASHNELVWEDARSFYF